MVMPIDCLVLKHHQQSITCYKHKKDPALVRSSSERPRIPSRCIWVPVCDSNRLWPLPAGCLLVPSGTRRFGSTAKVLADCKLKYYRISECQAAHQLSAIAVRQRHGIRPAEFSLLTIYLLDEIGMAGATNSWLLSLVRGAQSHG